MHAAGTSSCVVLALAIVVDASLQYAEFPHPVHRHWIRREHGISAPQQLGASHMRSQQIGGFFDDGLTSLVAFERSRGANAGAGANAALNLGANTGANMVTDAVLHLGANAGSNMGALNTGSVAASVKSRGEGTQQQAPDGRIPEWANIYEPPEWAKHSDAILEQGQWDQENDFGSEYESEDWPKGDYEKGDYNKKGDNCASGDEPEDDPPPTPNFTMSPSAAPVPPVEFSNGPNGSACYARMPDCCELPLKESLQPASWFVFGEATNQKECKEAQKKLNWWCCKWGTTNERGTDRKSITQWTTKKKLPTVSSEDVAECSLPPYFSDDDDLGLKELDTKILKDYTYTCKIDNGAYCKYAEKVDGPRNNCKAFSQRSSKWVVKITTCRYGRAKDDATYGLSKTTEAKDVSTSPVEKEEEGKRDQEAEQEPQVKKEGKENIKPEKKEKVDRSNTSLLANEFGVLPHIRDVDTDPENHHTDATSWIPHEEGEEAISWTHGAESTVVACGCRDVTTYQMIVAKDAATGKADRAEALKGAED